MKNGGENKQSRPDGPQDEDGQTLSGREILFVMMLIVLAVVGVVFINPVEFLPQDADRRLTKALATFGPAQRLLAARRAV